MKLVIVESPTKAKTISKFLGKGYVVESSYGHVRDLPKSQLGVDVEHDFEPKYLIPQKAKPIVKGLKAKAESAKSVILATDEDREGEAIAWHLVQALGLSNDAELRMGANATNGSTTPTTSNPRHSHEFASRPRRVERIVFHEITKQAIEEALENPRAMDMNLIDAQQARRVLDRLVGYELSPFLWRKVRYGLSAGRVQSVALRLVVEREREIENFKKEEYWTIEAGFSNSKKTFGAKLYALDGKTLGKLEIGNEGDAKKISGEANKRKYKIGTISKRSVTRTPSPPFTTSTMQQEAARKLGFSAKQTMMVAQRLYEEGFITYMRTDSVNLAASALAQAKEVVSGYFGEKYALAEPRRYITKTKGAQEAHEAIRPTDLAKKRSGGGGNQGPQPKPALRSYREANNCLTDASR